MSKRKVSRQKDNSEQSPPNSIRPKESIVGNRKTNEFQLIDNELFSEFWNTLHYDGSFQKAIQTILIRCKAVAVLAHIAGRSTKINYCLPTSQATFTQSKMKEAHERIEAALHHRKATPACQDISEMIEGVSEESAHVSWVVVVPDHNSDGPDDLNADAPNARCFNYCAFVFSEDIPSDSLKGPNQGVVERNLRMVFSVIRRRERRFSPFPARISERYWKDASYFLRENPPCETNQEKLQPPWQTPETSHATVTLSLDLRKSTFCMAQVRNLKDFAHWLDELVGIMTAVGHMHGGVFDKFTGDGCLIHFLEREYGLVYGQPKYNGDNVSKQDAKKEMEEMTARAALDCAVDMQRAMEYHMQWLRPNLRMDSDLLGAGVAIGSSDAFWSFDHHDNPIVVGQGVVDACRLCDKAESGQIIMANNAYFALPKPLRERTPSFKRRPVTTKELNQEIQVIAWVLSKKAARPADLGTNLDNVFELCEAVYQRSKRR